MRPQDEGVLTCSPSDTLEGIIPKLNKVTGMPVISVDGKVIGVISRKVSIELNGPDGFSILHVVGGRTCNSDSQTLASILHRTYLTHRTSSRSEEPRGPYKLPCPST